MLAPDHIVQHVALHYGGGEGAIYVYGVDASGEVVDWWVHLDRDSDGFLKFIDDTDETVIELQRRWDVGELEDISLGGDFRTVSMDGFEHAGHNNPLDPTSKERVQSMRRWLTNSPTDGLDEERSDQFLEPLVGALPDPDKLARRREHIKRLVLAHLTDAQIRLYMVAVGTGLFPDEEHVKVSNMLGWQTMICIAAQFSDNLIDENRWRLIRAEARLALKPFYRYHDVGAWATAREDMHSKFTPVRIDVPTPGTPPLWVPDANKPGAADIEMLGHQSGFNIVHAFLTAIWGE